MDSQRNLSAPRQSEILCYSPTLQQDDHGTQVINADNEGPKLLTIRGLSYSVPMRADRRWNLNSLVGPYLITLSGKKFRPKRQ
jgi:hypothetical protein